MEKINIKNLTKSFGNKKIFEGFNFKFGEYKVNTIIGASGSGKSTLLNIISGLESIDDGDVSFIEKGDISYIFQEDRLIPWLNVNDNMILALKKYYNMDELKSVICKYLELVGVIEYKSKFPKELSGGIKQRINIARALAKPSKIILMDEPFKSLDYKTKYNIMREFKSIIKNEERMLIFVTHDVDEAIYFGGQLIVFKGSPIEISGVFNKDLKKYKEEIIESI